MQGIWKLIYPAGQGVVEFNLFFSLPGPAINNVNVA